MRGRVASERAATFIPSLCDFPVNLLDSYVIQDAGLEGLSLVWSSRALLIAQLPNGKNIPNGHLQHSPSSTRRGKDAFEMNCPRDVPY